MRVTLDQVMMLVGRMDDAQGFDSPRERFRRFLQESVHDVATLSELLDACLHAPGDQHLMALQDLIVLLGRFLHFDVAFGFAGLSRGAFPCQGVWHSPASHVSVVVEVWSARTSGAVAGGLVRSIEVVKEAATASHDHVMGLAVQTPLSMDRRKIEAAVAAAVSDVTLRVAGVGALVSLAEMVTAGGVGHAEVVRLLESDTSLDFIVTLLARSAPDRGVDLEPKIERSSVEEEPAPARQATPADEREPRVSEPERLSGYWLVQLAADHGLTPDEQLNFVIARRQVLAIAETAVAAGQLKPGDEVCFYIHGRGVVGRARVAATGTRGATMREGRYFSQVARLERLTIDTARPFPLDPEVALKLTSIKPQPGRSVQVLVQVSAVSFWAMTKGITRQSGGEEAGFPGR